MNKNTKLIYFSLIFLLLFILANSGCTPVPYYYSSDYGNMQVNSEPSGASIFLNGSHIGFTSPKLIKNLSSGSYLVTFKLDGYLNSNNFVQVYPNQTTQINVVLTPNPYFVFPGARNLLEIDVKPDKLNLFAGETGNIDSIIAYYSDDSDENISPDHCSVYSTNQSVATIDQTGQITALSEGQATVWITYSEAGITKSDGVSVTVHELNPNLGNMVNINILPTTMVLDIGESKPITSITAYYESGTEKLINPEQCSFNINNSFVSITSSGMVTGNSPGVSIITVTYSEGNITKSDTLSVTVSPTISNQPTYWALAIGIGDYIYYGPEGDLLAPPYDVNKMKEILYDCRFGTGEINFYKIIELKNTQATKTNIFQKIQSAFSGTDENDISYFYFSGHGALVNQESYLCPADFNGEINTAICVDELEAALSTIPGTKVVFIDSCHSGGFVGKDIERDAIDTDESEAYLSKFNESIINTFTDPLLPKDLLTSNEYQVLTSSSWYQSSYELNPGHSDPFGVFTQALYEGCSLNNNVPADTNFDHKIVLQEAYLFISQWVRSMRISQDVQVYPLNSAFSIFEY